MADEDHAKKRSPEKATLDCAQEKMSDRKAKVGQFDFAGPIASGDATLFPARDTRCMEPGPAGQTFLLSEAHPCTFTFAFHDLDPPAVTSQDLTPA